MVCPSEEGIEEEELGHYDSRTSVGRLLELLYKPLVPVIKTLEIFLFQFQENSESKNLPFEFFWVKKRQREPVLFTK
jgi:hypothetical protein